MSQRVLITAGASGIGWAMAQAFLDQDAKVHVMDIDADAVEDVGAEHGHLTGSVGDVSNPEHVRRALDGMGGAHGGLDVLISNARGAGPPDPVVEDGPES